MTPETGTARIRWEDNELRWDDNGCLLGYVGTPDQPRSEWLFQIVQDNDDPDDETLTLLVALHTHRACDIGKGASPVELKAEAERWLSEFASSLGAIFPAEPTRKAVTKPAKPVLTPNGVCDVLLEADFALHGDGQMGFTTGRFPWTGEVAVSLVGVDLLPFNPGEGPRALLDDYARALNAAGYATRITVNTVIVTADLAAREGERL